MRETGISCSVNVEIACGGHVMYNTNRVSRYLHSTCVNLVKLSKFRGRHGLMLRFSGMDNATRLLYFGETRYTLIQNSNISQFNNTN